MPSEVQVAVVFRQLPATGHSARHWSTEVIFSVRLADRLAQNPPPNCASSILYFLPPAPQPSPPPGNSSAAPRGHRREGAGSPRPTRGGAPATPARAEPAPGPGSGCVTGGTSQPDAVVIQTELIAGRHDMRCLRCTRRSVRGAGQPAAHPWACVPAARSPLGPVLLALTPPSRSSDSGPGRQTRICPPKHWPSLC